MSEQRQIRITVTPKMEKLIEAEAKKFGVKKSTYCFNVLFEKLREKENESRN